MSFIYLILGIIGWTAVAIVLPMYVWFGKRNWRASFRDASAVPSVPSQRQGLPPSN